MKGFKFLVLFAILATMLAPASLASAAPPVFIENDFGGTDFFDCGTFTIQDTWTGHAEITRFYDNHGNFIRGEAHITHEDHFTGPDGKEAFGTNGEHLNIMFFPDTERVTGLDYHIVVPGVGMVLMQGGYAYFDYNTGEMTFHGKLMVDEGDFGAICAALAPD
jgi:hypothetical protein